MCASEKIRVNQVMAENSSETFSFESIILDASEMRNHQISSSVVPRQELIKALERTLTAKLTKITVQQGNCLLMLTSFKSKFSVDAVSCNGDAEQLNKIYPLSSAIAVTVKYLEKSSF